MNFKFRICSSALMLWIFLTAPASCAFAGEKKVIEHVIRPGESVYTVAKKMLSPTQRKQFISWLGSASIEPLKPKDVLRFECEDQRVLAFEYGALKKPKRLLVSDSVASKIPSKESGIEKKIVVAPGDNFMHIADRHAFPKKVKAQLLAQSAKLGRLKPNDLIEIRWDAHEVLTHVSVQASQDRPKSKLSASASPRAVALSKTEPSYQLLSVSIRRQFHEDAKAAGVPASVWQRVRDVYQKNETTKSLLKPGARLEIIYDPKQTSQGLVYARLSHKGKHYEAIRYQGSHGLAYYDAQGKPYEQGFLRVPLGGPHRLSSSFSLGRKHPILGRVRPHYGVDFSAKHGSPVWASGSGTVVFAGYQRGYGRVVKIQHSPSVVTLYAHLSKFESGVKVGARIAQKQVLGYVGSSGLSTGPHLHYEYHINNQPRDPMTVALSKAKPLKGAERVSLLAERKQWLAMANTSPAA